MTKDLMLKFKPGDLLRVKFSMGQLESRLTPSILVLEIRDRLDLLAHVSVPHYVILDRYQYKYFFVEDLLLYRLLPQEFYQIKKILHLPLTLFLAEYELVYSFYIFLE